MIFQKIFSFLIDAGFPAKRIFVLSNFLVTILFIATTELFGIFALFNTLTPFPIHILSPISMFSSRLNFSFVLISKTKWSETPIILMSVAKRL